MDPYNLDPAQPATAAIVASYPPRSWPSKEQLDYTQKAITCLLLILALPWLVYKLLTAPSQLIAGAGRQHVSMPD